MMEKFNKVELVSICGASILVEEKNGSQFTLPIEDYRTREQLTESIHNALFNYYLNEEK